MDGLVEFWLDELIPNAGEFRCPRCGGYTFTVSIRPYGIELACFNGPHYTGIRKHLVQKGGLGVDGK